MTTGVLLRFLAAAGVVALPCVVLDVVPDELGIAAMVVLFALSFAVPVRT